MNIVISGTSSDIADDDANTDDVSSATIELRNDDFDGDISVSQTSISEGAEETEVTVTVRLRNDLSEPVNVQMAFSTNTNNNDYAATWKENDSIVEIAAGAMEGTVTLVVTPTQDNLFEGDETIEITGTSAGQKYQPGRITLADDETKPSIALSVSPSPSMVKEGKTATFTVTADLSGDTILSANVTVTLNFTGSATMGESGNTDNPGDYTVTGTPITIEVGTDNSVTQNVTIDVTGGSDDDTFEGNETIIIGGTADGYDVSAADAITLVDDDYELSVYTGATAGTTAAITENGGEQTVTVTALLNAARITSLGTPLTVTLSVESNDRYTYSGDLEIKIGSGETMDTTELTFTPVDDELYSSPLTFSIDASAPNYNILGSSVTLNDDENAPVNAMLSVDKAELTENGGAAVVRVTAEISQGDAYADKSAEITLGGVGDLADIYTITGEKSITISAGSKTGYTNLTITPIDNSTHGANVAIMITGTSSDIDPADTNNDPDISSATVTIVNDDFDGTITISPASVAENAGADQELTVTVNLDSSIMLSNDIVVTLTDPNTDDDLTAVGWKDNDDTIEISAGGMEGSATLVITPNNDNLYEGNESYMVTGAVMVGGTAFALNLKPGRFTVTDDETKPSIALSVSSADGTSITEGTQRDFTVTADLSGDTILSENVTVTLTFDGTASRGTDATSAGDYLATGTLTIPVGTANTATTTVTINADAESDDSEFEGNETIIIGGTTNGYDVTAADAITLVDDDYELNLFTAGTVEAQATAAITENGGEQTVTVTAALDTQRIASLTSPLTVTISVGQHARYAVTGDMEIKIGSGETFDTTELTFTPVQDELYSDPLTIEIQAATASYNILGSSVMLNDDEVAPLNAMLSVDKSELAENGGAAVVKVTAEISQGDAYADKDAKITLGGLDDVADVYTVTGEKSITIPAGSKTASTDLTITPIDNSAHGMDDEIMITGTSSAIGDDNVGNDPDISSATVTIVNDDFDGTIAASPSISESGGEQEVTVTVSIDNKLSYGIEVTLTGPDDTSADLDAADWKDMDNTVEIAAGDLEGSATLVITPTQDTLYEGNETFMVSGMVAPAGLNLKPGRFTLTDDETKPSIALSVSHADGTRLTEGDDRTFTLTAKLTGTTTLSDAVTVTLNFTGTASKGADTDSPGDYLSTATTVTIASSQNEGTEQVAINTMDSDDTDFEGNETIVIGGTTNGYDVTAAGAITIVDDDYELDLYTGTAVNTTASITENGGEQTVTVTAALRTDRVASLTSPLTVTLSVEQNARVSVSGDLEINIGSGETSDTTELTFTPVEDELYSDPLDIGIDGTTSNYNILGTSVTLNDDELQPMKASLSVDNDRVNEDGGATSVVVTGRIIQGDAYADKEAKIELGGLDDVADSYAVTGEKSITIAAGAKTGSTTITITPENNEAHAADVPINITGTSSEISDGDDQTVDVNPVTVTIVNDDYDGYISTDVSEIKEAGGEATIVVTANLSEAFSGPVTVDFSTIPGAKRRRYRNGYLGRQPRNHRGRRNDGFSYPEDHAERGYVV